MKFFWKRFFDVLLSILALAILSPLFLLIAAAIKLDSRGPVIFKQKRLTKHGQIFDMYKFRSMVVDAEHMGTGLYNYKEDPRVTKVGRLLRNSSLDELPQLVNVVRGDLSLVGPRPSVVYELGDYDSLNRTFKKRFTMRGGITGLAQIKGRNENAWAEKVIYDNQYIDLFHQEGLWLDVKILIGTVINVLTSKNVYEEKIDASLDDVTSAKLAEEEIIRLAHQPEEPEHVSMTK